MATNNRLNYSPVNHSIQVGAANGAMSNIAAEAIGKFLQGVTGADPAFSTATYPSTATGTGKILRADGTNWSASTATYPNTAGTSGNVLTSDGTNWSSSAPSSGTKFFIKLCNSSINPVDATTYYMFDGGGGWITTNTTAQTKFLVPTSCTMTAVYAHTSIISTLGSAQNVSFYIRVNDTTDYTVSTTWQWTANTNPINVTGLSVSLVAGDYIQFKIVTPTWTTNPTNVSFCGSVLFQ